MEIILIFLRHYLLCLIGAFLRFILDLVLNTFKKEPILSFSWYWNYKVNPQNELKDAFIGFIFLGIILSIIF